MAISKRPSLLGFFLCTFFLLLASALGHAQCTGTGPITCTKTESVSIPAGPSGTGLGTWVPASVYPSQLTVSGLSGTIGAISVQLHGLTSNATGNSCGTADLGVLLKAPNGSYMELMGLAGNCSATSPEDWTSGGVTLTIQDGGASGHMPYSGDSPCDANTAGWPHPIESGGFNEGTFSPTSCPFGNNYDTYPSPGPGTLNSGTAALPWGTATLGNTFGSGGLNPNGTWELYLVDDQGQFSSSDTLSISGWSLIFTLNAAATSTSTTLSSNPNPSFTSGANSSVTLTATVTGTSTVNAGTVAFKDGTNTIACGGGTQAVNGSGQATCVTILTTQGNHALTADYSGGGSFNGSNSSTLNQFVETPTTGSFCNAGGITIPGQDNTSPYPSVINVSGITNAVATVSLTLNGFSFSQAADAVHMLLVSPDNKALEFFSAGDGASSGTYNFSDTGINGQPSNSGSTPLSPGNYIPAVYTTSDVFTPQPPLPAPQVPGSFTVASPAGGSSAGTFESTFNGATANGAWSLFAYDIDGTNAGGSITGGWCLNITQASGAATTTTVALTPNPALTGESVTVTATVKSGGSPVTAGTVTFTENGQNIAGGPTSPITVNGAGQASFGTTALPEGDHNILATYNGVAGTFALSFGNKIQRVDSTTVSSVNSGVISYCNPGTITIPSASNPSDEGQASPNPSNIFVTNAPGTIQNVTVTLNGVKLSSPYYLTSLLVGPLNTTADSLDFFSDVGGATPMGASVNVTLSDGAASNLSTGNGGSALTAGSFKPTSGNLSKTDTFFPSADLFYTPPLSSGFAANYAAPASNSTLDGTFASQNPNGIWSLYLNQDNFATGSSISSWCVNLTENQPTLTVAKHHSGDFAQGQQGAQFTVDVTNNGPGSTGDPDGHHPLTVVDTLPAAFTSGTLPTGTPWDCSAVSQTVTCTSDAAVAANGSYPTLTIPVNVASNAGASANNQASISGGGAAATLSNIDTVTIDPAPVLALSKTHQGSSFNAGQTAEWDITVSNTAAASSITSGTTTVSDSLPAGYTLNTYTGTGWGCSFSAPAVTCTSTQGVAGGSSFPTIALTVNVPANSPSSVTNTASAFGGGDLVHTTLGTAASGSDSNVPVNPATAQVTVTTNPTGLSFTVDNTTYSASQGFTWVVGSSHTISTTSPQAGTTGTQYAWNNWSDTGAISHGVTGPSATTTYTANFDTQYQLTTAASPTGGGTVTPTSGNYYTSGTIVPLTATANTGYNFSTWTGNVASSTSASTSISMTTPQSVTANFSVNNSNVTINTSPQGLLVSVDSGTAQAAPVSVNWQVGSQHTIATTSPQTPSTGTQETFGSWSDSGAISHIITVSAGTPSYTATFYTSYQLTTAVSPTGGATVTPTSGNYYTSGTIVPLTATANTGYNFSSWAGPVASSSSASTTVTMSAPESVTANFVVNNSNITINTSPQGLLVSVDGGTAHSAPLSMPWQVGSQHTIATTSPQTPVAGTQFTFANWSDSGPLSHTITVSAATPSYTATFNTSYLLTTAVSPSGSGTVTPTSGTYYAPNTVVNLTATANSGSSFSSWTGPVANASSASTTVTMSAAESVTANFTASSAVSIVPGSINFGTIVQYKGVTQLLLVTNNGTTNLKFTKISLGSMQNITSQYLLYDGGCMTTLAPGKYCRINITIAPNVTGNVSAVLTLQDNAPGSPQTVPITATVIGPKASLRTSSLSFGNQGLNTPSAPKTVTLTNTGVGPLTITGIAVTGSNIPDFSISSNTCVSPLGQGLSCTVGITFTPKAKSSRSANLTFTDNSTASSTQSVSLSGKGT